MTEPAPEVPVLTRRRAIAGAAVVGVGGTVALFQGKRTRVGAPETPATSAPRTSSRPIDQRVERYATRTAFDVAESNYRRSQQQRPHGSASSGGDLAWRESRVMSSYLTMYRATRDSGYLDKLVEATQTVLAARDDRTGRVDYLGRSRPGWSAAEPYTVAQIDLIDKAGAPALRLTSAAAQQQLHVDVRPGSDELFELRVAGSPPLSETVRGLSLDIGHPRYVVRLLQQQYPGRAALTAVDLRSEPAHGHVLASATGAQMTSQRYVFAVHTGMISAPMAQFAALLVREPDLRRRYAGPAADLLRAAEAAVQLHDADWRQLTDQTGIYASAVGAPVRADGTYLPHNQYLVVARCLTLFYLATRNPEYRRRATLMLNLFQSDLSRSSAPTWSYYWSGSQPYRGFGVDARSVNSPRMDPQLRAEDPSHGALDVDALIAGLDAGLNVPASLMTRLVATFLNRVVQRGADGNWVTAAYFGSHQQLHANDPSAAQWIGLARWDRRIYAIVLALLDQARPLPRQGYVLSVMAQLAAFR